MVSRLGGCNNCCHSATVTPMTAWKTLNVSITPGLHAFIARRLGSGRYGNVSEVVRAASRLMKERELRFDEHRRATIDVVELDVC